MKKFIFTTLILTIALFTACSDGNGNGEGATYGRLHEMRDFGGKVITIGSWWEDPVPEVMWGDEEPDPATSSNYLVDRMMWDNARRVERAFNVRFEQVLVPDMDFIPQLSASVLAREPFADIVFLNGRMQMEAMGSLIQPWNTGNLPGSDVLGAQVFAKPLSEMDGDVWIIESHGADGHGFGLGVNMEIIAMDNLPNPVELYEAGEWTWDAMFDIMNRATRDTTGGGVFDQFGIAGQPGDIVMHFIGANDGVMVDDNLNYGFDHPNTMEALEFLERIFHARLWSPDGDGIMYGGNWERNFYSGFREANAVFFPIITWAISNAPLAFEFRFVPFPQGPSNTSGNTWIRDLPQGMGVTVGTEWEVADLLMIMEELFSWPDDEPELLFLAGDIDWMRVHYLTEDCVQRAIQAALNFHADIGRNVPTYYWVTGMFASAFWEREMDVSGAVEYQRGPHQELLDMRFR
ncbi:MAG: hypothetical protein FWF79_09025 [Defluviitaleaceae bacterium]|nr:hypothetical protein [Defluviitaleaceae bacterium]